MRPSPASKTNSSIDGQDMVQHRPGSRGGSADGDRAKAAWVHATAMLDQALPQLDLAYTRYNSRRSLDPTDGVLDQIALGGWWVVRDHRRPDGYYNRVLGLGPLPQGDRAAAADWLAQAGRPLRCTTLAADPAAAAWARAAGGRPERAEVWWVRQTAPAGVALPRGISVRTAGPRDLDAVFDMWTAEDPQGPVGPQTRRARAPAHADPRFVIVLAECEGQVVGMATCFLDHGWAWLGNAHTRPAWRGRGIQQALIHARVACAHDRGVPWALCDTEPGHTSERNLARCGFALGVRQQHWRWDSVPPLGG